MSAKEGEKCRLCFAHSFFHMNLFATSKNVIEAIQDIFHCEVIINKYHKNAIHFRLKRNFFCRIQIDEFDQLPNFVCVDCWVTVEKFHTFYKNVNAAQNKFLLNERNKIKDEVIHDLDYDSDCKFFEILINLTVFSCFHGFQSFVSSISLICLLCAAQLEISNVVSLKQDERVQRAEEHSENTEFQEEIQTEPLNYYDEDYTLDCDTADTADEGDDFDVDGGDDEESDPDFNDGSDSGM